MRGWDFSHIRGRYEEGRDLPWSYDALVRQYRADGMQLLDQDTGGGEYLLSLGHPPGQHRRHRGLAPQCRALPPAAFAPGHPVCRLR